MSKNTAIITTETVASLNSTLTLAQWKDKLTEILKPIGDRATELTETLIGHEVIDNDAERDAILADAGEAKKLASLSEKFRKLMKAPILEAGDHLDSQVRNALGSLSKEVERIERMCGEYTKKQRDAAEAARRERERLEQEAAAKAREAQALKDRADELAMMAAEGDKGAKKEVKEVAKQFEQAASEFLGTAAAAKAVEVPVFSRPANAGRVSEKKEFAVTDYAALYEAMPHAFNLEAALRRSVVQSAIDSGRTNIPGIDITDSIKTFAKTR